MTHQDPRRAHVATAIPIPPWTVRGDGQKLATYIEVAANLEAWATSEDISHLALRAREYKCAGFCVASSHISLVADGLARNGVKPIVTIGFPFGSMLAQAKASEAVAALAQGARGVEMILPLGAIKEGRLAEVEDDIRRVVEAVPGHSVNVVFETGSLSERRIKMVCRHAEAAGAAGVVIGTGFQGCDATIENIRFLRQTVSRGMSIKAAGVKTSGTAWALIKAGADIIGTNSMAALIRNDRGPEATY